MQEIIRTLRDCIVTGDRAGVTSVCEQILKDGIPALVAINDGMVPGLQIVGDKFQAGEYFLVEMIAAGAAMEEGLKVLEPHLQGGKTSKIGRIVLGTVQGDMHSIGKDIVSMLLRGAGFDTVDLGVDVPTERFVEAVRTDVPAVLGLSALITVTMPEMGNVVLRLKEAGLRERVKIIVGGAPLSAEFAAKISADSYAPSAPKGVDICKEWVTGGVYR